GRKELGHWERARHHAREVVRRVLIRSDRAEQLLLLGWRRLERGDLTRELEHRHRAFVALLLVVGHRVVEAAGPGEGLVERVDEELDLMKRVGDAERGDRVLVVSGVADERPPGPVRLAEEVLELTGAREARLASRRAHALGEPGN